MKSSGLRPNGSQTRAAAVTVSTPRWTSAPLKKVPLKDVRTCPFVFPLVVDAFYYMTPNPEVLHLCRNPPIIDGCFFFFFHSSFETRAMTDLASSIFHSVTHLKQSPAVWECTLPLLRSRLTREFQGYNIDATYSPPLDVKISQLVSYSHRICSVFYFTEHFKWRVSLFFLAHYAIPRTPCSSWF